jgi:hypothetical protein
LQASHHLATRADDGAARVVPLHEVGIHGRGEVPPLRIDLLLIGPAVAQQNSAEVERRARVARGLVAAHELGADARALRQVAALLTHPR